MKQMPQIVIKIYAKSLKNLKRLGWVYCYRKGSQGNVLYGCGLCFDLNMLLGLGGVMINNS